jgi:hypothetical protein
LIPYTSVIPTSIGSTLNRVTKDHVLLRNFDNSCEIFPSDIFCDEHTTCLVFTLDLIRNIAIVPPGERLAVRRIDGEHYIIELRYFDRVAPFRLQSGVGSIMEDRLDSVLIILPRNLIV